MAKLKEKGATDQEISKTLGISRSKVARIRKKNGIKSTKGKITDESEFIKLYNKGFTDSLIAKTLGVSRGLVIKFRNKLGLKANFAVGGRSAGKLRDNEPLYYEAKRVLKHIETARMVRAASRMYLEEIQNSDMSKEEKTEREVTAWAATIIDPTPMFHPAPGSYTPPAEKTNLTGVRYAVEVESRSERINLVGVPAPELLNKALELKGVVESAYAIKDLVGLSGYVGLHETVASVTNKNPDKVKEWKEIWRTYQERSEDWAPLKVESQIKMRCLNRSTSTASTGKKGKGGGCQNIHDRRAYAGAAGY
ncbi:MAG: carbamoyl phosphate synthase large subunit [Pelotomaculum sp. PtaB.Bin104]|nr:MAG: carbamoyl phosphate synthase large subunit [Pelotomaculum sp. PtaB.Bin104]